MRMKKIYLVWSKILFLLLLTSHITFAQTNVSGKVTDARTGEAVVGVNVVVKGTTQGTITNENGEYTISVASGGTLQFSFIGYLTEELSCFR